MENGTTDLELFQPDRALAEGFEVLRRARPGGGEQILARFPNGYGVSIVQGLGTYGSGEDLWELAVLRFTAPGLEAFDLCYDTPITDDVMGWLDEAGATNIARRVAALPQAGTR